MMQVYSVPLSYHYISSRLAGPPVITISITMRIGVRTLIIAVSSILIFVAAKQMVNLPPGRGQADSAVRLRDRSLKYRWDILLLNVCNIFNIVIGILIVIFQSWNS